MASVLLLHANSLRIPLAHQSCHMVVTSPPYWGLRDYGIGAESGELGSEPLHDCLGWATGQAWTLRDDLTEAEVLYVYQELKKHGVL